MFAVRRVVARVDDPANEWLFTEAWGVDVAVSTQLAGRPVRNIKPRIAVKGALTASRVP